ncbi:uncharacterized protein LOC126758138 [Bactrocera neohumeralis]|uniref:uncharacterized protein LOC126758138 n=1 Tax=Bactrocera neohumeralis TaxID=98809 RepID=UPI002166AEA2|nr:uncharacterized protein LOC126758138 [Bactrocera neohumeralis]
MLKKVIFTIFALTLATDSVAKPKGEERMRFLVDETNRDHEPYADLALYMVERYISSKTSTLIIMENCEHCFLGLQNMHTRLLRYFLKRFNPTMSLQLFFGLPEDRLWDYNIFIVDSMHAFKNLSINIPETSYEHQFHFFIILTLRTKSSEIAAHHMRAIFNECLRFNVDNVVVMLELDKRKFGFYTYYLFADVYCHQGENIEIVHFNTYFNGSLEHDRLFPQHLRDFHGCQLFICLEMGYPLLGFHGNRSDPHDLQDIRLVAGIEGDLLKDLAKALNFRVNFSISKNRGVIGENNDSTGCFAELAAGKADIAIGCLSSTDGLRHVFSYSISYHQSLYVFIVRSGLHFGPIKQLVHAFCRSVWQAIGICCVIGMIFIRFVISCTSSGVCEKLVGQRKHSDSTNLIVVMMGYPIKILPSRNCARLLLMSWLLATLVLRNAYQAKMFDSLRISRRIPIPRTIAGLEEKNYIFVSDKYTEFYPRNMTRIISNITQRYRMVQQSDTERLITSSMLDTLAWHNRQNWKTSSLTYVDEPIYNVQISMYFKKHSIFRSIFDDRIKKLSSAGITSHLGAKHVKKQFQVMNANSQRLPAISSNMLRGLYILYAMLMTIAFTQFSLELLTKRAPSVRRAMDWIHYVGRD